MSDSVEKNLEEFIKLELPEILQDKLELICADVEAKARENCPVDDGTLRASLAHTIEKEDNSTTGYIGSNLEYAPYVHQGTGIYAKNGDGRKDAWIYQDKNGNFIKTVGQKPQPFINDAIEQEQSKILDKFKEAF